MFLVVSDKVVRAFEEVPSARQRENTNAHVKCLEGKFVILLEGTSGLHKLNDTTDFLCAIIKEPQSNVVILVYGSRYGASDIGYSFPLDGKLLQFEGQGGGREGVTPPTADHDRRNMHQRLGYMPERSGVSTRSRERVRPHMAPFSKRGVPEHAKEGIILLIPILNYTTMDRFEEAMRTEDLCKHMLFLSDQTGK